MRRLYVVLVPLALVLLALAARSETLANLLTNPDFRTGILAPTGWGFNAPEGNRVSWLAAPGGTDHAVQLESSGRDWAGLTSQSVKAAGGERLTVAAWVRGLPGQKPTDADRLFVRFFRAGGFVGQEGPALASVPEEWTTVAGVVTAPEAAGTADVSFQLRSKAQLQVASVCLLRGERLAEVADVLPLPPPKATDWKPVDKAQNVPADANDNGLPEALESFLKIRPEDKAVSARRVRGKTTSFQTPTGYREDNDLKVDTVIVAGNQDDSIRSWAALGYEPHVMVGFRAGQDYLDAQHEGVLGRDEVQTDSSGTLLTCGPGSYYMVPTENRRRFFRQYFADAVSRGAKAACPEEPEFFSRAGYSEAFKREWQARYAEPWQDPTSSVEARYRSERLKVELERKLLQACYAGARSVDPKVQRFVLTHSPLNYTGWGITFGHHDLLATGEVDAVVAQVWTGTARTPVPYAGQRRERTFENGFLEYASCVGLTRDLPVDLWFLMDPLEDNPDRTMEDYHGNYLRTLAASLMFPEVTRFETMPWPTRIFGRVPDDFATEICSVINVLSDMQNQHESRLESGTTGIGTFLSDSAMWQRGDPHPSNPDCFYGLTMPLLMRGLPVAVPHLDRAAEPGYLDRYRVLLVSYDMLKPLKPEFNEALAAWARKGGCLLVFGGDDPYNAVPEWWRTQGFESPQDHLLSLCGFDVSKRRVLKGVDADVNWTVVAKTDYTGRNLENQTTETLDLTPFLKDGSALIKCGDSLQEDGWGALITKLSAEGVRNGKPAKLAVRTNTPEEHALIAADGDSGMTTDGHRFCDQHRFVVYRFDFDPGSKATLRIEIGNQYMVSAAPSRGTLERRFEATTNKRPLGPRAVELSTADSLITYGDSGARPLYASQGAALLSEKEVGNGTVLCFGASPSSFARSAEAADQLRALVRYAVEGRKRGSYREQQYFRLQRGRYLIVKTFEEPLTLRGQYVDVLQANLPVVSEVRLGPDQLTVLYDASPDLGGDPRLLFSSSCVEWRAQETDRLRLIVSGARGVFGTCRVFTGGRSVASIRALTAAGREVSVDARVDGNTVLLRYPNEPFGLGIRIDWGAGNRA
ncbi:MAG: hypothetical protein CO096_27455 [Armatimonadetes bacterium CG_4_9_14_3_um_filter_66_14]|nr:MAG: hypothetical protein CO096_27455 [Armatimonadetes bacterium CG_4_9_14_3_um_filter_66_14]